MPCDSSIPQIVKSLNCNKVKSVLIITESLSHISQVEQHVKLNSQHHLESGLLTPGYCNSSSSVGPQLDQVSGPALRKEMVVSKSYSKQHAVAQRMIRS